MGHSLPRSRRRKRRRRPASHEGAWIGAGWRSLAGESVRSGEEAGMAQRILAVDDEDSPFSPREVVARVGTEGPS